MIIGLVGAPSSGKSTFFKAATLADVEIANYPFTTIEKNEGVGFVKVDCVDKEFNVNCNPRFGFCINNKRFVPVQLIDVAGLVPDAHKGKGRGNKFLDDLRQADVLIHVVDASGSTNTQGEVVPAGSHNPLENVEFLEREIDMWYLSILERGWNKFTKQLQSEKLNPKVAIANQLSGLKVSEEMVAEALRSTEKSLETWNEEDKFKFAQELRKISKPIIIAANKIDIKESSKNIEKIKNFTSSLVIPCSAESELALKEANKKGLIEYIPGENNFKILKDMNEKQKNALDFIKKNILEEYQNTGIQDVLDKAVFDVLKYIAIFPGGVNKLADQDGNIIPDCFLLPENSTALDFAYKLHNDFGKNFIRAIDAKSKRTVGKEHKLSHRDVIEIVSGK